MEKEITDLASLYEAINESAGEPLPGIRQTPKEDIPKLKQLIKDFEEEIAASHPLDTTNEPFDTSSRP